MESIIVNLTARRWQGHSTENVTELSDGQNEPYKDKDTNRHYVVTKYFVN